MIVLGVDPGISGGIAIINGDDARVWDLPTRFVEINGKNKRRLDHNAVARLLGECLGPGGALAFVEKAQASPQMGVSSAFGYGEAYGLVIGVLAHLRVPMRFVTGVQWKRSMGLVKPGSREIGRDPEREKRSALDLARRLYPRLAGDLALQKNNGRADALLIAHYGCEQVEGALFAQPTRALPRAVAF